MAPRRATHPAKLPFPVTPPNPSSTTATIAPTSTSYSTRKANRKAKSKVPAMQAPTPTALSAAASQDSVMGSWSTLSIPKSLVNNNNNTVDLCSTSASIVSPPPPPAPSISKSIQTDATRMAEEVRAVTTLAVATAGPSSLPGPSSDSLPSPPLKAKSRRKHSRSTPPSSPPAPRRLIPEPAPPPSSSLLPPKKTSQRVSSSSKDRRPALKHVSATERRIPTPFPYPPAANGSKRRSRVISASAAVPLVPLMPVPHIPSVVPAEAAAGLKGSGFLPVRRPSPVPPSSSKSKSTRSSDSYVSLDDHTDIMAELNSHPAVPLVSQPPSADPAQLLQSPRTAPRRPSLTHLLASFRSNPPRLAHPSPIPGVPRIFHPSPLNPNPQPSPLSINGPAQPPQRSPVNTRSPVVALRPVRTTHIIPLPSLTFASIQQRPIPLPQSEAAELWTPTQTGAEEYASDHPQDLVERAWEMEERDELERVKRWVEAVAVAYTGGVAAEEEEDQPSGDEFWQWEKPADIDLTKLVPNSGTSSRAKTSTPLPVNDMSPTREEPPPFIISMASDLRTPSPYPAPQPPPDIHLDSSSAASSSKRLVPDLLNVPLATSKSFTLLTSPSPFSGLPSPFRLALPTPFTPFRPLREAFPTPSTQEPLPPVFLTADSPALHHRVLDSRVASALDHVSSYISAASPRHPSPETPPRIVHSSTDTHAVEDPQSHTRTRSRSSSRTNSPIPAVQGWSAGRPRTESDSTMSGGFTRSGRGRSPTRRSWKAASERATTRVGVGMVMERIGGFERARIIQPVYMDQQTGVAIPSGEVKDAVASDGSWDLSSLSDAQEYARPRSSSRSPSRSIYSSPAIRPDTGASIRSADLFYPPQPAPTPSSPLQHGNAEPSLSSSPETLRAPEVQLTAPVSLDAPRQGLSTSMLRRRKSHRAPSSVASHPERNERQEEVATEEPEMKKVADVNTSQLKSRVTLPSTNLPISLSTPITHKEAPAPAPISLRLGPSPVTLPVATSSDLVFHKFMILLSQFSSDLSNDRRGVPRWKHDFAEAEEKVRVAYEAFRAAVERSKVDFRPWLRDVERMAGDREDDVEGEEGKPVMFVEDVWEKMMLGSYPSKGSTPARAVQEDIIRSVVSTWDYLASACLNDVRDILDQLVMSIVDLHFGCAGDGNELRMIVQSIADTQLHAAAEITSGRLSELAMLESTYVFSASDTRFHHSASTILSQYKEIRRHSESSMLEQGVESQSPVPISMADSHQFPAMFKPYYHIQSHSHSMSRDSQAMSSTNNTKTTSLFSKGPALSTNPTVADDIPMNSDVKAGLRQQLAEQQRLRANSLRSVNDAVQVALTSLRNLGLSDLTTPEKLYEKLVEPDPVDEVLEVMANVEAYVDAASSRFIDYATLHLEHHFVNSIGEKIFTAVLERLDLGSSEIKDRCLQWMSASGQ